MCVCVYLCVCVCEGLTSAGGLRSRPGAVGEAGPLGGAVQGVAHGTVEAHLAADAEVTLAPAAMRRGAGVPTSPRRVTCYTRHHKHKHAHSLGLYQKYMSILNITAISHHGRSAKVDHRYMMTARQNRIRFRLYIAAFSPNMMTQTHTHIQGYAQVCPSYGECFRKSFNATEPI